MTRRKAFMMAASIGMVLQITACKGSSTLTQGADSDILTDGSFDPVVIVLGGFWSCGSKTTSKNFAEWSPIETHSAAANMVGVATKNLTTVKAALRSDVNQWLSCYTPEIEVNNINFVNTLDQKNSVSRTSVDQMIDELNKNLNKLNNPKVAIIGHSYGGWTAMKLALNLTPKATLSTLVTIDPISKQTCTPRVFLNATNTKDTNTGCHRAPGSPEFSQQDLEKIAKRSNGFWYNYYQTDAKLLHSSAIGLTLLKEDQEVKYAKNDGKMDAHILFLKDESFVEKVAGIVAKNLKN